MIAERPGQELRQHERISVAIGAVLLLFRKRIAVTILDISRGGAMIRIAGDPPGRGDEVVLELEKTQVVATIAWIKEDCLGLAFHRALEKSQLPRGTRA